MLITKCILSARHPRDDLRISIMSRHTLNDGVTLDPRITPDLFDYHWPELAPPPHLIGAYYKHGLPWEDFAVQYQLHIRLHGQAVAKLAQLVELARSHILTVMCIEQVPDRCHRRLLAEFVKEQHPEIDIVIT